MGFFDFLKPTKKGEEAVLERVEPTSVYEAKDEVIVSANLPGVRKDEISLNITPGMVTIKVQRKRTEEHETEVGAQESYSAESELQSFTQTVSLPALVSPREAQATFKNNVLEIRLPKHAETKRPKGTFVQVR